MRSVLAALITLVAFPAASEIHLLQPVDCVLGETCFIQNYVDHDPGPNAHDFRCGDLTYDGHKGTDFALPTLADMKPGVNVRAASPGIVKGVRDGMDDVRFTSDTVTPLHNRECGNGVVISGENGWETQYCHLRKGSVRVAVGDQVAAGTILGQVGLSGKTQFPHLHFSLRKNGQVVDPFVPDGEQSCAPAKTTHWQAAQAYTPGGLISAGFADQVPGYDVVLAGNAARDTLPAQAAALVLFGHAYGSQPNDVIRFEVFGPQGTVFSEDVTLDKVQAQLYRAVGRRLTTAAWPDGIYNGVVSMIRNGKTIAQKSASLSMY